MATTEFSLEITYNKKYYVLNVNAEIELEDTSFDHEFGTQEEYRIEIIDYDYEILVKDKSGNLVKFDTNKIDEKLDNKIYDAIFDKIYSIDPSEFIGGSEREDN